MRLREAFHVESWPDRPWAIVWDPQGFREPGCETFLTFWAWQDLSPRRLRREAAHLADAWNGLRAVAHHGTTATEADWHAWIATMTRVDRTPRQLARQVETLYRFYAFWHWYDPRRVPRLFWPSALKPLNGRRHAAANRCMIVGSGGGQVAGKYRDRPDNKREWTPWERRKRLRRN